VGNDGWGQPALADHGLEVIARAYKALYAQRTETNRVVKERQATVDQASAKETAAYDALSTFRVENALPEKAMELQQAERALNEAKRAEVALDEQARAAEQSAKAQTRTREKIASLRQKASDLRANQPIAPTGAMMESAWAEVERAADDVAEAQAIVNELKAKLAAAEATLEMKWNAREYARAQHDALETQQQRAEAAVDEIANIEGQALELEQALGSLPIAPSEAQFEEAERRIRQATAAVQHAQKSAELAAHAETVDKARAMLRSAQEDAAALDKSVKTLADDAPAALLAAADGIKGLTIDGDDIFLDGVSLDQLSGQERLFFAVEIARRLNAKSKLICVDGLEVLDAEHRAAFIAKATEGGYQMIATRVVDTGGDPVAVPIHSEA
jgi:chromosome segregation ATPase